MSFNCLRSVFTSRTMQLPIGRSMRPKLFFNAVTTQCKSTLSNSDGTCQRNLNLRPGGMDLVFRGQKQIVFHAYRSYSSAQVKCWNCKQPVGKTHSFFCVLCKVVQPAEEDVSYFQIMDCDYTFTLDTQKLQRKYLQLQRSLHPDNFSQKSPKEQEYSANQSALVNKAYTTLLKPLSRGLYMLSLEGLHIEEGTDPEADPEFLMMLMEINEALDQAQTKEEADKIGQDTKGKLADLTEQIDTTLRKGELQAAKVLLSQMKYFANIEEKVKDKLSEFM